MRANYPYNVVYISVDGWGIDNILEIYSNSVNAKGSDVPVKIMVNLDDINIR